MMKMQLVQERVVLANDSIMHKKGFSLVEIVVATVILSMTMLGITNLFVSTKIYLRHSRCRMQAVNLGRWYLDELSLYVRQDQFEEQEGDYIEGNPLRTGSYDDLADFWLGYPPIRYKPSYRVSAIGTSGMRKVKLELKWIEPVFWKYYAY